MLKWIVGVAGVVFFFVFFILGDAGHGTLSGPTSAVGGFAVIVLGLAAYFIPTMLGWEKRDRTAIFLLNLFLGWTLVGWVVALVWAVKYEAPEGAR